MTNGTVLGTPQEAENLLRDLYVNLRTSVHAWAKKTNQTPQARMGYVGQHLVSAVTGLPGGRSGARGKDLVLPNGEYAEIKTCYRVDQLGQCLDCRAPVASIEQVCANCNSSRIDRKDDSKWLIGIRDENELASIVSPLSYYFVLFEFVDLSNPKEVRATIWKVKNDAPGLIFALVDYWLNIRSKSNSKAPLNIWPHRVKFLAMRPEMIYSAVIHSDDSISTEVFAPNNPIAFKGFGSLVQHSSSQNMRIVSANKLKNALSIGKSVAGQHKKQVLQDCDNYINHNQWSNDDIADLVAGAIYVDRIKDDFQNLPEPLRSKTRSAIRHCFGLGLT
mgnify:CR=1 FL=1